MANDSAVTARERPAPGSPTGNGQQPSGSEETPPQESKRRPLVWVVVAVVAVIAVVFGTRYYQFSKTHVATDDAYVTGNLVNISPIIGGTLRTLTVSEGDVVKKGQLIARLEDSGQMASLRQAQEAYKAAQSEIPQARSNLRFQEQTTSAAIAKATAALGTQAAKSSAARGQITLSQSTFTNQVNQARQQVATAAAQAAQADAQASAQDEAIQSAQQAVQTAQHAAAAANANINSARANYAKTAADEKRYQRLLAQQAITQQQYDAALAAFQTADAQLSAVQDQYSQAQSAVAQAKVGVQQAVAQAVAAKKAAAAAHQQVQVARAGLALAQGTQSQIGIQQSNYASNVTQVSEAQADLNTAKAGQQQILMRREQIDTLQAQAAQAKAMLANAQVAEDDTYIYAPTDGEVVRKGVNVGAALSPGQTMITMTSNNGSAQDIWVVANLKETQMAGVKPGEPVEVDVDAFPGKVFKGTVESVNSATGASTSLLPPDNATGNFTKVVQRIPVKIVFIPASPQDAPKYATADDIKRLRQGMSVTPTIEIQNR